MRESKNGKKLPPLSNNRKEWEAIANEFDVTVRSIVDAPIDYPVILRPQDIAKGDPADPHKCPFSLACKRQFQGGSRGMIFFGTRAYVSLPNAKTGVEEIQRFVLGSKIQNAIKAVDHEQPMEAGTYVLEAPKGSYKMAYIQAWDKKYRQEVKEGKRKPKRGQALRGEPRLVGGSIIQKRAQGRPPKGEHEPVTHPERSGSGMISFRQDAWVKKAKQAKKVRTNAT